MSWPRSARALVESYQQAFNDRDLDAWAALFAADAAVVVESGTLEGRAAIRALAETATRALPGIQMADPRVEVETETSIVMEYGVINPQPEQFQWRLEGTMCDILEMRDGRIAGGRHYYLPDPRDRTNVVQLLSRTETAQIAEEREALQRLAGLVAQSASPGQVFAAVGKEVAGLVGADIAGLLRFDADDTITVLAVSGGAAARAPSLVGERRPLNDRLRGIRTDGRPLRIRPDDMIDGEPFVAEARARGVESFVLVPVEVDGQPWGLVVAGAVGDWPFPDDTEARIAGFTQLVGTAIAGAQARDALRRLLDEQRALRSVATRVAEGAPPVEIFDEAGRQASRLLGVERMILMQAQPDGSTVAVATSAAAAELLGATAPAGEGIAAVVKRTARTARIDDCDGGGIVGPDGDKAAVGAPILFAGEVWGLLLALSPNGPLPSGTEGRLTQLAELVATSIGNAAARRELTDSRARVVAAADESRRRIQRDLHDGAQQRLVHTVLSLRLAQSAVRKPNASPAAVGALLDEALQHAEQATAEMRDLVHGILPNLLNRGGLRAGVRSLVDHIDALVQLDVTDERFDAQLETTAYFVIAETLTNAVKHAAASSMAVRAEVRDGALEIEVRDDGVGGADATRGSGLVGLADRVAVNGGTIAIASPSGGGTLVMVSLPVGERDRCAPRRAFGELSSQRAQRPA